MRCAKCCRSSWTRRARSPVFTFVDSDLKFNKPEVRVSYRSRQGADAGHQRAGHRADAAGGAQRASASAISSTTASNTKCSAQLTRDFRSRPGDLGDIAVRALNGERTGRGSTIWSRCRESDARRRSCIGYNRYTSATLSGTLAADYTMGDGIAAFEASRRARSTSASAPR